MLPGALATLLAAAILGAPPAQAAGPCANEAIRAAQTSTALPDGSTPFPDCMALELVSPAKKFNQYAKAPAFSANGDRIRFRSVAALSETPKQGTILDPYVATRGAGGWSAESTSVPAQYPIGFSSSAEPCSFSPDLSRWATWASTEAQAKLSITTAFGGSLGGSFEALSPTLTPAAYLGPEAFLVNSSSCSGASNDVSRFFFGIGNGGVGVAYLPGDPVPSGDKGDVYEAFHDSAGDPSVELLTRDKDGGVVGARCGAQVGGAGRRGAISPDATRVFFSTRPTQPEGPVCDTTANKSRIMVRTRTAAGPEIAPLFSGSECTRVAPPCSAADGDDVYQGASQEGDRVLFTTTRQLTDSDKDVTDDLYLFDASKPAGQRLTQLSAGSGGSPGEGAEVLGVPDFAGDGSHAYFVAKGVLTTAANPAGDLPQAGQPNLYLTRYPSGGTAFVGTLAAADEKTWKAGPGKNAAAAVPVLGADPEDQSFGGDGHVLVFQTVAPLLAEDSDGGFNDIYRYDSTSSSLQLISKGTANAPLDVLDVSDTAGKELGAGPQSLSFGRWVSEDGDEVVFQTKEALDPADTNGGQNAYLWRAGETIALPFGIEPTLSLSGDEIAFVSDQRLLPEDGDGAKDVYLLRAGGGFPIPVAPTPCAGEACQGGPAAQPGARAFASTTTGAGNRASSPSCKKGSVRQRGRCVAQKRKKKPRKHAKKSAGHKRGSRK